MIKIVNGLEVAVSTKEEAEILAEWAENDRPRTSKETSDRKDAQVEAEFTPALLALVKALDPASAGTIIAQAKANRKAEL